MPCASCGSSRQAEFTAEINIHLRGGHDLHQPGVFLFPKLLLCLKCGFSQFTSPEAEVERLVGHLTNEFPSRSRILGEIA
jgi:hypothetical protein